jgi:hypothetical protein
MSGCKDILSIYLLPHTVVVLTGGGVRFHSKGVGDKMQASSIFVPRAGFSMPKTQRRMLPAASRRKPSMADAGAHGEGCAVAGGGRCA